MGTKVIVTGHITVAPQDRDRYLRSCADVVRRARATDGCVDFAVSADLIDAGRINVVERWTSQSAVEAFRGSGPDADQGAMMIGASVTEYRVSAERSLT